MDSADRCSSVLLLVLSESRMGVEPVGDIRTVVRVIACGGTLLLMTGLLEVHLLAYTLQRAKSEARSRKPRKDSLPGQVNERRDDPSGRSIARRSARRRSTFTSCLR